ncbi:MAG: hypothetical protein ACXADY_24245 [Candidatus Hodarchaeales archaeon]
MLERKSSLIGLLLITIIFIVSETVKPESAIINDCNYIDEFKDPSSVDTAELGTFEYNFTDDFVDPPTADADEWEIHRDSQGNMTRGNVVLFEEILKPQSYGPSSTSHGPAWFHNFDGWVTNFTVTLHPYLKGEKAKQGCMLVTFYSEENGIGSEVFKVVWKDAWLEDAYGQIVFYVNGITEYISGSIDYTDWDDGNNDQFTLTRISDAVTFEVNGETKKALEETTSEYIKSVVIQFTQKNNWKMIDHIGVYDIEIAYDAYHPYNDPNNLLNDYNPSWEFTKDPWYGSSEVKITTDCSYHGLYSLSLPTLKTIDLYFEGNDKINVSDGVRIGLYARTDKKTGSKIAIQIQFTPGGGSHTQMFFPPTSWEYYSFETHNMFDNKLIWKISIVTPIDRPENYIDVAYLEHTKSDSQDPSDSPIVVSQLPTTNITYEEGTTGHSISWIATDTNPSTYRIYRDGTSIINGAWNTNVPITINVDRHTTGFYNYTIVVYDLYNNTATETVIVTVTNPRSTNITTTTAQMTTKILATTSKTGSTPGFAWFTLLSMILFILLKKYKHLN